MLSDTWKIIAGLCALYALAILAIGLALGYLIFG